MNSKPNRRDFLKTGLAGVAGAAVLGGVRLSAGESKTAAGGAEAVKPVLRTLGRTGITLPVVGMGTGDTQDPKFIEAALDTGIVLLGTSHYYGDGLNERMLGQVLKGRKRGSAVVMTSVMPDGFDFKNGVFTEASKPEPFLKKFEASLKNLETDCVDIFLLPFVAKRESVFFEPMLKTMEGIKKQGKARFIGVATHQFEDEAILAAAETGVYDVVLTAVNFRKENRLKILSAAETASKAGLGVIAMKTMAGRFWDKEKTQPINGKAALKWVLRNECIHTSVPGITTHEQLKTDWDLMKDLTLSDEEKAELKLSFGPMPDAPYCQQCGECVSQCRHGLDIPTAMRAYMYAYGYGNVRHAQETLALAGNSIGACNGCGACTVRCSMRSDIRSKMLDIARLADVPRVFLA
jgi:uncharacterized protein